MLTKTQLARFVHSSGLDDPGYAQNEVILTYLLQLLDERGFIERVVFKGGTCLCKMMFGNRGRFSTDLDFTARTEVADPDGEILALAELLEEPFHGIQFRLDVGNEKEWRSAENTTWAVYPTYAHGLGSGEIKFEVSLREVPILEPALLPQLPQTYFTHLEFAPTAVPCLHESELIAEKLRAAYQRRKARDIYDLAVFATRPRHEQLIRKAFILKLWNVRKSFDPAAFEARLLEKDRYDWDDLFELIPKRDREAPEALPRTCAPRVRLPRSTH
jgi:predicted nucleotidyltransferase component of viral defense system